MQKARTSCNKENRSGSPAHFNFPFDQERLKRLQSLTSGNVQGCQKMEIGQMSADVFKKAYSSDPIFKSKVDLMFEEEKKLLKTNGEMISKEQAKKKNDSSLGFTELEKGTTLRQRNIDNMLTFVELCSKLRTYL